MFLEGLEFLSCGSERRVAQHTHWEFDLHAVMCKNEQIIRSWRQDAVQLTEQCLINTVPEKL